MVKANKKKRDEQDAFVQFSFVQETFSVSNSFGQRAIIFCMLPLQSIDIVITFVPTMVFLINLCTS